MVTVGSLLTVRKSSGCKFVTCSVILYAVFGHVIDHVSVFPCFNKSSPATIRLFIFNANVAIPVVIGLIGTKRIDRVLTLIV